MFQKVGRPGLAGLAIAIVAVALAAAGAAVTSQGAPKAPAEKNAGPLVAFLLPENVTARWEGQDHPFFVAALKKLVPGIRIDTPNAGNKPATQQSQAEAELTKGAKVLVIAAIDQKSAAVIVNKAKAQKVPVIAYDRLIRNAPLAAYDSFDGVSVGKAQGTWLKGHTKKGDSIVVISGADTDDNAHLFAKGYLGVLNPLFKSGARKLIGSTFTPGWDPPTAQREMEQFLTKANNKVQGVLSANDGMAGGIIAALKAQSLAGKVPVTGQDASLEGIQRIVLGTQGESVFKDITAQAAAAAKITAALLKGNPPAGTFNAKVNNGMLKVPSVILPVVSIDKSNVQRYVPILIKKKFFTKAALCKGLPKGKKPC